MPAKFGPLPTKEHNQKRGLTRDALKKIADESLNAIASGSYTLRKLQARTDDVVETFDLLANVKYLKERTLYYGPDSVVTSWVQPVTEEAGLASTTKIWAVEKSTLDTAHWLIEKLAAEPQPSVDDLAERRGARARAVGVLNFASAKHPGGGFLTGSQAQEESIARSSTLYPSLMCPAGQQFYTYNHSIMAGKNDGYYSHGMIYSPSVIVFRNDTGRWLRPYEIDVLTSPAVNAGVVWQKRQQALKQQQPVDSEIATEDKIRAVMKERMARLLYLFELQGTRNLVLGSFGTGVFKNSVDIVADLWAELLVGQDARFGKSFKRVIFGVIGHGTYLKFAERFGTDAG
ncbi:hypothetical protein P691DRAFT_805801 [Macrolepiota fuliginosa MF-IS2]|uniref:Microbial-type PARG catalytic domain-containing protein n=1 Tax=Macrolepiota fuliginosa MF-IS2 TaxID=1400762 RepID=A0A9P5X7X6_9AGAR|nr:hypothetical protein P691DRAFT_805801 [Macrolepiota fuliginosa MF-IS2]